MLGHYLTSFEFWTNLGSGLGGVVVATAILVWLGRTWIGERIKKDVEDTYNAKQQQRKAEFDRALEEKRSELSKELEGWKAGYQKALDENRIRFSKLYSEQADAIKMLYGLLIKMERKLRALTSPLQMLPRERDKQIEMLQAQRRDYIEAFVQCRDHFQENRIYFSKRACEHADEILNIAHKAYVEFTAYDDAPEQLDTSSRIEMRQLQYKAYETINDKFPLLRQELEAEFQLVMGLVDPIGTESGK